MCSSCRQVGCRSAASPCEGRALNTNVSGPAILRFTNLTSAWATATSCKSHPRKGIFSSQTTGSEGGLCQSQNRQAHRETEWTGAHHYGGKWQEQWTQHGWTGPSPLGSARKQWVCEPAFLHQLCQHCTVSQCSLGEHGFRDTTSEHISTNPLKWVRRKSTQRVDFWKKGLVAVSQWESLQVMVKCSSSDFHVFSIIPSCSNSQSQKFSREKP